LGGARQVDSQGTHQQLQGLFSRPPLLLVGIVAPACPAGLPCFRGIAALRVIFVLEKDTRSNEETTPAFAKSGHVEKEADKWLTQDSTTNVFKI
jgi:hypothetical protein